MYHSDPNAEESERTPRVIAFFFNFLILVLLLSFSFLLLLLLVLVLFLVLDLVLFPERPSQFPLPIARDLCHRRFPRMRSRQWRLDIAVPQCDEQPCAQQIRGCSRIPPIPIGTQPKV